MHCKYSHFTRTTTWTDPRTLSPIPLLEFKWRALPPGWERFQDEYGDIYYVKYITWNINNNVMLMRYSHDTCSTHWNSPRDSREEDQVMELQEFVEEGKERLKVREREREQY